MADQNVKTVIKDEQKNVAAVNAAIYVKPKVVRVKRVIAAGGHKV